MILVGNLLLLLLKIIYSYFDISSINKLSNKFIIWKMKMVSKYVILCKNLFLCEGTFILYILPIKLKPSYLYLQSILYK